MRIPFTLPFTLLLVTGAAGFSQIRARPAGPSQPPGTPGPHSAPSSVVQASSSKANRGASAPPNSPGTQSLAPALFASSLKETNAICQAELSRQNIPGLVIVVVEGSRIAYVKACGVANVETKEAITPDHLFRVGSTTKMMVGAAVAALSESTKLRLDEPIGRLLPDISPKLADLNASQLLSHTAGLMDRTLMYGAHDDGALAANVAVAATRRVVHTAGSDLFVLEPRLRNRGAVN